jgi:hypothetical protein
MFYMSDYRQAGEKMKKKMIIFLSLVLLLLASPAMISAKVPDIVLKQKAAVVTIYTGGRVCLDREKRFISDKLPVHTATCF